MGKDDGLMKFLCMAEVLDPRYLGLGMAEDAKDLFVALPVLDDIKAEIVSIGVKVAGDQQADDDITTPLPETNLDTSGGEPAKKKSLASLLITPSAGAAASTSSVVAQPITEVKLHRELHFYLQMTPVNESTNVLKWWQGHQAELPLPSSVSRYIMAACTTSGASERLFSLSGHIVSKRRNALKPSMVNMLVFLAFNSRREV